MEYIPAEPMPQDGFINIMLMHCDLAASGSIYNPISAENIASSGADYFALGHIHKRTSVEKVGNTFVSYPGCPEGQGFDEIGTKGVYMGEIEKEKLDLSFIPCGKRTHIVKKIDMSSVENNEEAFNTIISLLEKEYGEIFSENLYKLILIGTPEEPSLIDTALLLSKLKEKVYFVKIRNKMRKKTDPYLLAKEPSLKGIFVRKMLERAENADPKTQQEILEAMYLGLEAFEREVAYDEDQIN